MKYEGVTKLESVLSKNSSTEIKEETGRKRKTGKAVRKERKMNKNFLKIFAVDCAVCLLALGAVFTFVSLDTQFTNTVVGSIKNAVGRQNEQIQNSVEDVYKTELVAGLLGATFSKSEDNFTLPVASANVQIENGVIKLAGEGSMSVTAACGGTVAGVTYEDGVKKVTLEHESGISSVYKGMTNVGVAAGDKVSAGQIIGISGANLEFCLVKDGEVIKSVALDGADVYIIEE